MVFRFLLPLFIMLPLYGANYDWLNRLKEINNRVDTKLEVGLYQPIVAGNIINLIAPSSFKEDFSYHEAKASFFTLYFENKYDYIPNIDISYFNMQETKSATLQKTVKIANGTFSSPVSTYINYQVFSLLLHQDFMLKGKRVRFFGKRFYSGDVKFAIGLNTQLFQWRFDVKNLTDLTQASSWISVNEFIPMPYMAVEHFWYDYTFKLSVASLAFSRAKSSIYSASVDYLLVDGLYISGGYLYEQFKVVEGEDTVDFSTSGLKVSFKYKF